MFPFIGTLIKKKYISAATGRLVEASMISGLLYVFGVLSTGDMLNVQAFYQAISAPILIYTSKYLRDLQVTGKDGK